MADTGIVKFGGLVIGSFVVLSGVMYGSDRLGRDGNRDRDDLDPGPVAAVAPALAPAVDSPPVVVPVDVDTARDTASVAVCTPRGTTRPLDADIRESSGVAVSRAHDGILWTHNDSGDPVLFAVNPEGRTVGRVRLAGATVQDWEDVARAPCAGGDCLFVADIGDNEAARPSVTVYRVREPAPGDTASARAEAIRLRYPEGPQDAEAMFVLNGAIHVVTKGETGPIALYRAPTTAGPGAVATMERVREMAPESKKRGERITGASVSEDGQWVVLRTLNEVSIYPAVALAGTDDAEPRTVDLRPLNERQGEGVAFAPDGSLVVTSEGGGKRDPATFARLACTLP